MINGGSSMVDDAEDDGSWAAQIVVNTGSL